MDLREVERRLDDVAHVCLLDASLLRRIIKRHRGISGIVPHARCYAIGAAELAQIASADELGLERSSDRRPLILVAKLPPRQQSRLSEGELFEQVLRAAFHARVHLELETKISAGELDERLVRRRIESLSRATFEELRTVFLHDEQLFDPRSDLEVYVEFAATYLELSEFSPELLPAAFPGLTDHLAARSSLALDLDLGRYLSPAPAAARGPSAASERHDQGPVGRFRTARLIASAERELGRGRHAECALAAARAGAEPLLEAAVSRLTERLRDALGADESDQDTRARFQRALAELARRSVRAPSWHKPPEAELLELLEQAVRDYEQPGVIVDLASFILALGKRPAVRSRAPNREVRLAVALREATELSARLEASELEEVQLSALIFAAAERADERARIVLRPKISGALTDAGLSPGNDPERHAQSKLVEELCDKATSRGFLSLPQLRDAISANELKLEDLASAAELWHGDALLSADARLSIALDGIYRRGDVYLRLLQKLSSVPFGTPIGRALTLHFVLPLLGSFLLLEGARVLLNPLSIWIGLGPMAPVGVIAVLATAGVMFALLHSERLRSIGRQLLDLVGVILAWIFLRIPRAILRLPLVVKLLGLQEVRAALKLVVLPALIAAIVFATLGSAPNLYVRAAAALASFMLLSLVLASRIGFWLEVFLFEQLAPTWRVLSRRWLPALLRLIVQLFRALLETLDHAIHRIDQLISSQRSRSPLVLGLAGTLGLVWSAASYVVRLYVTLLVEPEFNPLKHFPIVTVMHKLTLPLVPEMLETLERPLSIFGPVIGGAVAGVTVFLLPSFFGFLAWELKANYALYRASHAEHVRAVRFGPHGETLRELLLPGLHSGSVPKLYERLRKALERQARRRTRARENRDLARLYDGLSQIRLALKRFVERELLSPLRATAFRELATIEFVRVELSPNRIRVRLKNEAGPDCVLGFEQLGGRLVAEISSPGFVTELRPDAALAFENALAVFYHRADVDLVKSQIEKALGARADYEISDQGLRVWPNKEHTVELSYRLDVYREKRLRPRLIRAEPGARFEPLTLDSRQILFAQQRVLYSTWLGAWLQACRGERALARVLSGPPLW